MCWPGGKSAYNGGVMGWSVQAVACVCGVVLVGGGVLVAGEKPATGRTLTWSYQQDLEVAP